jgi:hypothetical protein
MYHCISDKSVYKIPAFEGLLLNYLLLLSQTWPSGKPRLKCTLWTRRKEEEKEEEKRHWKPFLEL